MFNYVLLSKQWVQRFDILHLRLCIGGVYFALTPVSAGKIQNKYATVQNEMV